MGQNSSEGTRPEIPGKEFEQGISIVILFLAYSRVGRRSLRVQKALRYPQKAIRRLLIGHIAWCLSITCNYFSLGAEVTLSSGHCKLPSGFGDLFQVNEASKAEAE